MHGTSTRPAVEPSRGTSAPEITVVRTPACHFCADAEQALAQLAATHLFSLRLVELESPEGLRLTGQHRPAMNPLVLVDGRFFSSGRLPRKKLVALLDRAAVEHTGIERTGVERASVDLTPSGDVGSGVS